MAKSRFNQRDKRRFIEQTTVLLMHGALSSNVPFKTVRMAVNIAGELWDEIEAQCPVMEEDD